ncbi:MAG: hypothetical protein IJH52_00025 [Oscillospiraceae bacterium]|nr:hypothetical protein [Oscillospiraceae bacterium]
MADNNPKYYRVGPDGNAPTGLSVGDHVVTGGGTYRIDAVHTDGSYVSSLVDRSLTTETYHGEYATPGVRENPSGSMKDLLASWSEAALRQKETKIDEQTEASVAALGDALAQANERAQTERDRNEIDAAKAKDNAALYAEARGDRGGIGQAQYNEIEAERLRNRQAISTAQTRIAAETARQIAALRAKGEFQKADALLDVTQKYLRELLTLEKWSANWANTQSQLRRSVEQWERSYAQTIAGAEHTVSRERQSQLASSGDALLKAGVMPSAEQLAAMGMTAEQARAYIDSLIRHGKL